MPSTVKREGVYCEKQGGGLPEEHDGAREEFFGSVERGGIHRRVSKGGGGVKHLPGKTVGSLSRRLNYYKLP